MDITNNWTKLSLELKKEEKQFEKLRKGIDAQIQKLTSIILGKEGLLQKLNSTPEFEQNFRQEIVHLDRIYRIQGARAAKMLRVCLDAVQTQKQQKDPFVGFVRLEGFFLAYRNYRKSLQSQMQSLKKSVEAFVLSLDKQSTTDLSKKALGFDHSKGEITQIEKSVCGGTTMYSTGPGFYGMGGLNIQTNRLVIGEGTSFNFGDEEVGLREILKMGLTRARNRRREDMQRQVGSTLTQHNQNREEKLARTAYEFLDWHRELKISNAESVEGLWSKITEHARKKYEAIDLQTWFDELDVPSTEELKAAVSKKKRKKKPAPTLSNVQVKTWEEALKALRAVRFDDGNICMKEASFHLHHLQAGFDLYVRTIREKRFERLAEIIPFLLLDLHVFHEQKLKGKIFTERGIYPRTHDLRRLSGEQKGVHRKLAYGLLWARYPETYLNLVPNPSERPTGLRWMDVANRLLEKKVKDAELREVNAQILTVMEETLPDLKESFGILKKEIESYLKGPVKFQAPSNPMPVNKSHSLPYREASRRMARLELSKELTRAYTHPRYAGYHKRNLLTNVVYAVEQRLAAEVKGEYRGHNLRRMAKLANYQGDLSHLNFQIGLHYPHYLRGREPQNAVPGQLIDSVMNARQSDGLPEAKRKSKILNRLGKYIESVGQVK